MSRPPQKSRHAEVVTTNGLKTPCRDFLEKTPFLWRFWTSLASFTPHRFDLAPEFAVPSLSGITIQSVLPSCNAPAVDRNFRAVGPTAEAADRPRSLSLCRPDPLHPITRPEHEAVIRIKKPMQAPAILQNRGAKAAQQLCKARDADPRAFQGWTFDSNLYGAKSVKDAL